MANSIGDVLFFCWFRFWEKNDGTKVVFSNHVKKFPANRKIVLIVDKEVLTKNKKRSICNEFGLYKLIRIYPVKLLFVKIFQKFFCLLGKRAPKWLSAPFKPSWITKKYVNNLVSLYCPVVIEVEYVWYASFFDIAFINHPSIVRLIQTYDIQYLFCKDLSLNQKEPYFLIDQKQEFLILKKFDMVVGISEPDCRILRQTLDSKNVYYLPSFVCNHIPNILKNKHKTFNICFIGGDASFNIYSVNWFISKVFSNHAFDSGFVFNVYGSVCDKTIDFRNVIKNGFVKKIEDVYSNNDLLVNPTFQIGGLKTKNVEALINGTPVLTTKIGSRGMEKCLPSGCLAIANSPQEFEKEIVNFQKKVPSVARCQKIAQESFGEDRFSIYVEKIKALVNKKNSN